MALNIDGEDVDPRLEQAVVTLGHKLEKYKGSFISDHVVKEIEKTVKEHRSTWMLRGVVLPKLAVVVLPNTGRVYVYRADLDRKGIQAVVMGLKKLHPQMSVEELARAMFRAYPDYAPSLSVN